MAVDPGRLAIRLREFSVASLPQFRAAAGQSAEEASRIARQAEEQVGAGQQTAARAAYAAETQSSQVEALSGRVESAEQLGEGLSQQIRAASEHAAAGVDVIAAERARWEKALSEAQATERQLAVAIEEAPARRRAALEALHAQAVARVRCCEQAVKACRSASGLVAAAQQAADQAVRALGRREELVAQARDSADRAQSLVSQAESRASQARENVLHAADAATGVGQASQRAGGAAEQVAGRTRIAEDAVDRAVDRLIAFDRGGL